MPERAWVVFAFLTLTLSTMAGPAAVAQEPDAAATEEADSPEAAGQPEGAPAEAEAKKALWGTVKDEVLGTGPKEGRSWVQRIKSAVIIIFLAWLTYRLAVMALRRTEKRLSQVVPATSRARARQKQQVATLIGLIRSVVWYVVAITACVLLLDNVAGVNVIPLLTGAGILGVAVAFGSQALVRDVVTGLFQLLEGQYAVGDYVQIGTAFGKVEHVGLRVTRLRDLQDKVYFIPNGTITMVTTYDDPTQDYVLQAPFAEQEQSEGAADAIGQLAKDLRAEFPELVKGAREPRVTTSESGSHAVRMGVSIVPTQEWLVNDEIPARVKQLFALREITLPEGRVPRCYADISPLAKMPKEAETKA